MNPILLVIALASALAAQQPPPDRQAPNVFEVVSIKPNHTGGSYGMRLTAGGRFSATNVSMLMLIRRALGIEPFQLAGSTDWMDAERYDVEAETGVSRNISNDELKPMLQKLLADRFALSLHREIRELPVYSLMVARGGPKLVVHAGDGGPSLSTEFAPGKATMLASNTTMAAFATALSRLPGRPVNDNTGLRGSFDFKLEWSPEQTTESTLPSLFTAVQELGLKLEAVKGPVEVVVIDLTCATAFSELTIPECAFALRSLTN